MIYGYCRISRPQQSVDRQKRNILAEYPDAYIVEEAYTGTKIDRPQWSKLYKLLKAGDTVVFDSVSRMSRDATAGYDLYMELFDMGISLVFLKEPMINSSVYAQSLEKVLPTTGSSIDCILDGINLYLRELSKEQIRLAFLQSEKEVSDIRRRTSEGILTAKLNGKKIGQSRGAKLTTQKSISAKEIILKHSKTFGGTLSDAECQKLCGCSRNSYYKYKAELKENI